jgi:hypothetical protein
MEQAGNVDHADMNGVDTHVLEHGLQRHMRWRHPKTF